MRFIVCIKQVPDTTNVKIDKRTGRLIREGIPTIINPEDKNALEAALSLKEKYEGEVIVISMGPPQADEALREALAMGADRAILLTDRAFAGADTMATAYSLGSAIKKVGEYDLVLCGRQAIDGDTAQVGPQLAEFLKVPQITYVSELNIEKNKVVAIQELEDKRVRWEANLPALLTITSEANKPRYPSAYGIMGAYREKEVEIWEKKHLDVDEKRIGLEGSPTSVKRIFSPKPKGKAEIIKEEPKKSAEILFNRLRAKNII
jgi:electron transfer flavoprotein beta subunit